MRTDDRIRAPLASVAIVALALFAALGCEEREPAPFAPGRDAGGELRDGGPLPMFRRDSGPPPVDGGGGSDGAIPEGDGGPGLPPTIDGVIGSTEWTGAIEAVSITAPIDGTPFAGDRLARILAIRDATRLYVAIEHRLAPDHAILLFLDADYGGGTGVVLAGASLGDFTGALDAALSAPAWGTTLSEFRPDFAWGTNHVPISQAGADADQGWRSIAEPSSFAWLGSATRSACTGTACETSIPIGTGGLGGGSEIAIAVRLGNGVGDLSNQTLPMDAAGFPETIGVVLRVPAP